MRYLKYFESIQYNVKEEVLSALVELEDMGFVIDFEDMGSLSEYAHHYKKPEDGLEPFELLKLYKVTIYKPTKEYFKVRDTIDSIYSLVSYMEDKYEKFEYHLKYDDGVFDTETINDIQEYIQTGMSHWIAEKTDKVVIDLELL